MVRKVQGQGKLTFTECPSGFDKNHLLPPWSSTLQEKVNGHQTFHPAPDHENLEVQFHGCSAPPTTATPVALRARAVRAPALTALAARASAAKALAPKPRVARAGGRYMVRPSVEHRERE